MTLSPTPAFSATSALLLLAFCSPAPTQETKGQRIYFSGHSFHYFMPPDPGRHGQEGWHQGSHQLGLSSIGGSRVYQHWQRRQTSTPKTAKDIVLPAETITVISTARFPSSGEIMVETSEGTVPVTYTGKTATTFTGCKGGKGTVTFFKKVSATNNEARAALQAGKVDVFTMAPIFLPDDGIDKFVQLRGRKQSQDADLRPGILAALGPLRPGLQGSERTRWITTLRPSHLCASRMTSTSSRWTSTLPS